jgi:hypothetical protein
MLARFKAEPALILGFVGAVIALVTAFGLDMSPERVGAIMALVSAGLALVVRSQVSPVAALKVKPRRPKPVAYAHMSVTLPTQPRNIFKPPAADPIVGVLPTPTCSITEEK